MKNRNRWFVVPALLVPALAIGASIQGPQLGFVFDSAKGELRPILGIPGAAVLGHPLGLGVEVRAIAISPLQDYVLAVGGEHNEAMVFNLSHHPLTSVAVEGADRGASQIVISAEGKAAALYYKDRNRIAIVTGLPTNPKVASELYISGSERLTSFAIADDGRTVVGSSGDKVFQVTNGGEVPLLEDLGRVTAIALPTAKTALIADGPRNQIQRIRGIGAGIETDVIAGSKEGISAPVGVAVSRDGSRAFVANGKSGKVSIIQLNGEAAVSTIACACKLTGLDRLSGNEVYRLTGFSSRPMWTLDAGGAEPRVLFVPAEPGNSQK